MSVAAIMTLGRKLAKWVGDQTPSSVQSQQPASKLSLPSTGSLLSSVLPYDTYDPDTELFINRTSMGFVLEVAPRTGASEEDINILTTLITDVLPAQADFQCLLWASNKIGPTLDAFHHHRTQKGGIFSWLAERRASFLKAGSHTSLSKQGSILLRDFRLYFSVAIPKKSHAADTQALLGIRDDISSTLKSIHTATRTLDANAFIALVQDYLNPSESAYPATQRWNECDPLSLQVTDPETAIEVFPNKLVVTRGTNEGDGDLGRESLEQTSAQEVHCFSVRDYPSELMQSQVSENLGQLFNTALQVPCVFWISLSIRPMDHEKSAAHAQLKYMRSDSTLKSPLAKFKPTIGKEVEDWTYIRDRLAEGDRLVKTCYQVILVTSPDNAHFAERKLRDLYRANGWKLRKEQFLAMQSWLAGLPMMMREGMYQDLKQFGRLRTMTAFNAMNIAPLQGEWKGTSTPSLLLPGRRGQITTWDPFDNQEGNYNVAIAARSGSGKSVFTQEYIVALISAGGRVWVFDAGRSYEKTCRVLNGEFIEFTSDKTMIINPFTHISDFTNESLPMLKPLIAAKARPHDRASSEELSYIEQALKAAWQAKGNQASITTVAQWLAEKTDSVAQNLSRLLYSYTNDGMYGHYFEGESNVGIDNPFVVLELQELNAKKDLQRVVLLVMMYQIAQSMYLGNRHQIKSCIIDEAWKLLGGDIGGAAEFIEEGYRTARRYRGNFVTITQSINDYYKNDTSLAAFENSEFNVILAQKAESLAKLKQDGRLQMDSCTERLYTSLRRTNDYSECIIKGPAGLSVHRILLDPYSRILYSSKGEEYEAVKAWQAKGLSLTEAIDKVAETIT